MFLVDTNVLVYATNEEAAEHTHCRRLLERWRQHETAWFTTWGVLYEFLRVVSHPRIFPHPWRVDRAIGYVGSLLASPSLVVLTPTSKHSSILAQTAREVPELAGNILHDVHTVVLMREHGIRRIVTRDADFHRFPFLEVIDPLTLERQDRVRERPAKSANSRRRASRPRARA
jgi:toxin-antitoxin system PIN domain toxin